MTEVIELTAEEMEVNMRDDGKIEVRLDDQLYRISGGQRLVYKEEGWKLAIVNRATNLLGNAYWQTKVL